MPLVPNHLFAGVLLGSFWEELPIPEEKDPDFFFFLSELYQYRINPVFQEAGGGTSRDADIYLEYTLRFAADPRN